MSRKVLGLIVVGILLTSLACAGPFGWRSVRGSGDVVEEEREIRRDFDTVLLVAVGNVYIEQGDDVELIVEAEDNLLAYIETEVRGNTLELGLRDNVSLRPRKSINFHLTVEDLSMVNIGGSGNIFIDGMRTDKFEIVIGGSGDVELDDLKADDLVVRIDGSGDGNVAGRVDEQEIDLGGSGSYEADELKSERADVNIGGSGPVTVWVEDELDVDIHGSGSVRYKGSPDVESSVSGSGKIEPLDD